MQSAEKLRQRVHEWLVKHELDRDTRFYTPEEWKARKEPYLKNPELVLIFEGACTASSTDAAETVSSSTVSWSDLLGDWGTTSSSDMPGTWVSRPSRRYR